jgi:hypothetical protein
MAQSHRPFLSLAVLLLGAVACGEAGTEPLGADRAQAVIPGPVEVVLAPGVPVRLTGTNLELTFVAVVEDSRCPTDVVCVWEGNAVVEVALEVSDGAESVVQLNSTLEPRSFERAGVRVTFVELQPHPHTDGTPPAEDYRLTLRAEPVP